MKKDSVKYKHSPLKGKRKLEYSTKGSSRSGSVKLPLIGKTIYLDVKEVKHVKRLQADLKRLGGTIEEFLSRDINYLITTQPRPKRSKPGRDCEGDSPVPSPFNCDPSPSPSNPDIKQPPSVTRGKALAEKARIRAKESNNLVENAEKWGVKIVSLEGAYKWIERELKKLPKQSHSHVKKHHKSDCVAKYKILKTPYLKIEASSFHYRPLHHELETWPRLNVDTPRGSCPFDGTLIKGGDQSVEERGDLLAAQVDRPSEEDTPNEEKDAFGYDSNTPKPAAEKSTKKSEQESVGGSRILTAGEIRRQKEIKRKLERKRGYCECCQLKYEDLDKHVRDEQHRAYIKVKSHYETLDQLIHSGPSAVQFISRCLSQAVSLKQPQKPASDKAGDDEEVALISPMKVATPPRKRLSAAVTNSPRKEDSPSKRKQSSAANINSSHQPRDSGHKSTKESSGKSKENEVPKAKEKKETSKATPSKRTARSPMVETVQYVNSNTINSKNLCTNDTKIVKRTSPRKSLKERKQENQDPNENNAESLEKVAVQTLRSPRNKHVNVEEKLEESRTVSRSKEEESSRQLSSPKPNRCLSALFDKEKKAEETGKSGKTRENVDYSVESGNIQLRLRDTKIACNLAENSPSNQDIAGAKSKVKNSPAVHKKHKVVEDTDSSIISKDSPAIARNRKSHCKNRRVRVTESGREKNVEHEDATTVHGEKVASNKTRKDKSNLSMTRNKTVETEVGEKKSQEVEPDSLTAVTEVKAVMDICNKRVNANKSSDDFEVCLLKSIQKEKPNKELDDDSHSNKMLDNKVVSDNTKKKSKSEKKKAIEKQEAKSKKDETKGNDNRDSVVVEPNKKVTEVSETNEPRSGQVDPCLSDFTYLGLDGEIHVFTKTLAERIKERSRSRPMSENSMESSFTTTSKFDKVSKKNTNKSAQKSSSKKCKKVVCSKKNTQAGIASKKVLSKYKVRRDSHRRHDTTQMGYQGDDERELEAPRTSRRKKINMAGNKPTQDRQDERTTRKRPAKWFYVMESEVEESESDQQEVEKHSNQHSRSSRRRQQNADQDQSESKQERSDSKPQPTDSNSKSQQANSRKKPSRFWFYEPEPASSGKDSENDLDHLNRMVKEKRNSRQIDKDSEKEIFKEPVSVSNRTLKKSKRAPKYWYYVDSRIQTDEDTESESNSEQPNNRSNKKLRETENELDDLSDKPQGCKPRKNSGKAKKFWYYKTEIISSDKQLDSDVEILPSKLRRYRDERDSLVDSISDGNRKCANESQVAKIKSSRSQQKFWYYEPEIVSSEKDSENEIEILPEKLRRLKGKRYSSIEGHVQSSPNHSRNNARGLDLNKVSQSNPDKKLSRSARKFWYYAPEVVTSEKETEDEVEILPEKLRRRIASTSVASVEAGKHDRDRSLSENRRKTSECEDRIEKGLAETKFVKNKSHKVSDCTNESRKNGLNSDSEVVKRKKDGRRFWEYVPYVEPENDEIDPALPKELQILKCPWNDVVGQSDKSRQRRRPDSRQINYDENVEMSEAEVNVENPSKFQKQHNDKGRNVEHQERSKNCEATTDKEIQHNVNNHESRTSEVNSDTEVVKKKRERRKFWEYVPQVESENDEVDPSLPKELQLLKCPWNDVVGQIEVGRRRNNSLDRKPEDQNRPADFNDEYGNADKDNKMDKVEKKNNKNLQHDQESRESDVNSDIETPKAKKDRRKFWEYVPLVEPESDDDSSSLPKELQLLKCPWNNVVDQIEGRRQCRNKSLDRKVGDPTRQVECGIEDSNSNRLDSSKSQQHKEAESKLRDGVWKPDLIKRKDQVIENPDVQENVYKKKLEVESKVSEINSDTEVVKKKKDGRKFWEYVPYVEPDSDKFDPALPKELQILKCPWNDVVGHIVSSRRRQNNSFDRNAEDKHTNMDSESEDSTSTTKKQQNISKHHSVKLKQTDESHQSPFSSDEGVIKNKSEGSENVKKKKDGRKFWEYVPVVEPDSDEVDPSLPKELQILKCPLNDVFGNSDGGRRRRNNSFNRTTETLHANIDFTHEDSDSTMERQQKDHKHSNRSKHKDESRQAQVTPDIEIEQNKECSGETENLKKQNHQHSQENKSRKSEVNLEGVKKKRDRQKFWEYVPCVEPETYEIDPALPKELQMLKCPWNDMVKQSGDGNTRRRKSSLDRKSDQNRQKETNEGNHNVAGNKQSKDDTTLHHATDLENKRSIKTSPQKSVRTVSEHSTGSDQVQSAYGARDNETKNTQSPTKKSEKRKKKLISVTLEENVSKPAETIEAEDTQVTCKESVREGRTMVDGSSSPKFHKKRKLSPKPSGSRLEERSVSPVFQLSPAAKRRRECDKTVEQLSNVREDDRVSFEVKAKNTMKELKSLVRLDKHKHAKSPVKVGKVDTVSIHNCIGNNDSPLTTPTKKVTVETPGSGYSITSRENRRKQWKRKRSNDKLNSSLSSELSDQDKKKRKLEKLKYKLSQDSGDLRLKSPVEFKEKKNNSGVKTLQSLDKDVKQSSSPNRRVKTSLESSFELIDKSDKPSSMGVKSVECNKNCNDKSGNTCVQTLPLQWESSVKRGLSDQGQSQNTVNQQPNGSASGGVVRMNQSWSLLSDRSASKLLSSENDRESFHGFSEEEIEKDIPSDLTYIQCPEMDVAPDSEHEWVIEKPGEQDDAENSEKDEFVKYLPPTFSSPGKRSDSSWLDACEDYIDKSLRKEPKDSSFNYSLTSPWRSPLKKSKSNSKHGHASRECSTPKKSANSGLNVEKVDQEIEFNFSSPQKQRVEFSPLRYKHGRVVDTSKSHSSKSKTVKQGQKSLNLQLGDGEFSGLRFSRLDDDNEEESDSSVNNVKEFKLLKKVSSNKKKYSLTFEKSPVKAKKHKKSV